MTATRRFQAWILAAALAVTASMALAASGDVLQVTAERAILRSGPSAETDMRAQVEQGDELVELERDGNWFSVRAAHRRGGLDLPRLRRPPADRPAWRPGHPRGLRGGIAATRPFLREGRRALRP
jgi:hypothetical protein